MDSLLKWIRKHSSKIVESIAFYPALIAISFLLLSWLMLEMDFSDWGKHLKLTFGWLTLKDASTARTIISTIVSGVMSLTVFSFSMVMIVLNQAASQMSNRILSSMIENRFQQIVLGFYIGTIVYALFLLSTIRDISSGIYVPALSIYLLILLTVIDIFLFIYFLDYVTQTVKFETVIHRVQVKTLQAMKKKFSQTPDIPFTSDNPVLAEVFVQNSGYLQGFDAGQLTRLAMEKNVVVSIQHPAGTYLIKGNCLMHVSGVEMIDDRFFKKLLSAVDIYNGQPIEINPDYGFHHLTEVALKALSPGINDPATAVLSLHALTDLFSYRLRHSQPSVIKDKDGQARIIVKTTSFNELFRHCIYPVWHYGKSDGYIQEAVLNMLQQLTKEDIKEAQVPVFNKLMNEVKAQLATDTLAVSNNKTSII